MKLDEGGEFPFSFRPISGIRPQDMMMDEVRGKIKKKEHFLSQLRRSQRGKVKGPGGGLSLSLDPCKELAVN